MKTKKRKQTNLTNEEKYQKRRLEQERREANKVITDKIVLNGYLIYRTKNSKVYIYKDEKLVKRMKDVQKEMFLKKVIKQLGDL